MNVAPIILFVYNRAEHTKNTIDALAKCKLADQSELYIYADGAKKETDSKVDEVRSIIKNVTGFKRVHTILRETNYGLSKNIIDGVTNILKTYDNVIVLEDDLVCHADFLQYMNLALEKYKDEKKVFSLTGYSYIKDSTVEVDESYFLKIMSSWSWATWKDRWALFDPGADGYKMLFKNKKLSYDFDYDGVYAYTQMMRNQMKCWNWKQVIGLEPKVNIDSWAIRWYWTIYKNKGLTLYPNKKLVKNDGFDGSGTHCGKSDMENSLYDSGIIDFNFPDEVRELVHMRELIKDSLRNI